MDALQTVIQEAKAFYVMEGRTSERAEKIAQNMVKSAISFAEGHPDPYYFFKTLGVSEEAYRGLAASM